MAGFDLNFRCWVFRFWVLVLIYKTQYPVPETYLIIITFFYFGFQPVIWNKKSYIKAAVQKF
jgi:hypothetical protein